MKTELDPLVELAVWGILDREKDLELILRYEGFAILRHKKPLINNQPTK